MSTTTRYGKVFVKANKTDPIHQRFLVRDEGDGIIEYYHKQESRWLICPECWIPEIVWDNN